MRKQNMYFVEMKMDIMYQTNTDKKDHYDLLADNNNFRSREFLDSDICQDIV